MSGLPLHPILVHFPIVLAALLPLLVLAYWSAGRRFASARKSWAGLVLMHILVFGSAYLAMQSGERDEERVEKVLASETPLETHEHKGELFLWLSGLAVPLAALGLAPGMLGLSGRAFASMASLAIVFAAAQAGHSGGKLVYNHGAAAAYAGAPAGGPAEPAAGEAGEAAGAEDDD